MVAAVADRAVSMGVPVVPGKEALEQPIEVPLGPRAGLHQRQARRRVRREQVDEPVASARGRERADRLGDVDHPSAARVERELLDDHGPVVSSGRGAGAGSPTGLDLGPSTAASAIAGASVRRTKS